MGRVRCEIGHIAAHGKGSIGVKAELLFENEPYRVVRTDCNEIASITVVHFEPWRHSHSHIEASPFGDINQDNFIVKKGMNALFVQTRRNDWYQSDGILDALNCIRANRRTNEIFVTYGTSMGGHAAASFSGVLNADFFLCASAQVSLCPLFMDQVFDRRWQESHNSFQYDNILDGSCRAKNGLVCFDSMLQLDQVHAERTLRETDAFGLDCPGTWHFAAKLLQREVGIMNLILEIARTIQKKHDLQDYLTALKASLAASFAARFLSADGEGKVRLSQEFGMAAIQKEIHLNALVRAFDLGPSPEFASILVASEKRLTNPSQKEFVTRMLLKKGYENFVSSN